MFDFEEFYVKFILWFLNKFKIICRTRSFHLLNLSAIIGIIWIFREKFNNMESKQKVKIILLCFIVEHFHSSGFGRFGFVIQNSKL